MRGLQSLTSNCEGGEPLTINRPMAREEDIIKKLIIILSLLVLSACATDPRARKELDCRESTIKEAQKFISEASETHWELIMGHGVLKDYYENCLKIK